MKKLIGVLGLMGFLFSLAAQPSFTANDVVPPYNTPFRLSINPNFNGQQWPDEKTADIAAGNPALGVEGVGIKSFRVPLPESFLEYWGYHIRLDVFQHYDDLGLLDNTVFLNAPSPEHLDTVEYCPGAPSTLFANMYEPIWDNGANGTPVNEDNYAAAYIYKTVTNYKDYVKFWEIWNEPDLDRSGNGWKPPSIEGNWFDGVPDPCDIIMQAPVYHYIRLLRISYEVIKTVDPDAYVTVGGLGYESFLDIILRHTDNPDGGQVTAEYPLTGGAYFDVLSYHVYPHINGSMKVWDNSINGFAYNRNTDAALDGSVGLKQRFDEVLLNYGYDGVTFPEKLFILTETTVPRKKFQDFIGSDAAARNYAMKMQVAAYQNEIQQLAFYQLSDQATFDNAGNWLEMSGLYEQISTQQPYDITPNESGVACRTMTQLLFGRTHDQAALEALNLPINIRGGAFVDVMESDTLYVLWAKTEQDESEVASANFSFPESMGYVTAEKMNWDFSVTNNQTVVNADDVQLTGAPTFFKGIRIGSPVSVDGIDLTKNVLIQPNPFNDYFEIKFELTEVKNVNIEICDVSGIKVFEWSAENMEQGEQTLKVEDLTPFAQGTYFGKVMIEGKRPLSFKLLRL